MKDRKNIADVPRAVTWLNKAIALHEKHMSGTAPTTGPEGEKSQQKMMQQMRSALEALGGSGGDRQNDAMSLRMSISAQKRKAS